MNKRDFEGKQRFSIRKLTIGACSILLSTLMWTINDEQIVHADTITNGDSVTTEEVQPTESHTAQTPSSNSQISTTETAPKSDEINSSTSAETTSNQNTETPKTESRQNSDNTNSTTDTTAKTNITDQSKNTGASIPNTPTSNSEPSTTMQSDNDKNAENVTPDTNAVGGNTNTLQVSKYTADKAAFAALQENKTATATTTTTNGGYDSATWGTLDTSKWTGQTTSFDGNNYYQLTGYTGDQTHIIVPNEADFEQAGKSTNNLQVSISNDLIKSWQKAATIAFSKTEDKKVKLASNNLNNTFQNDTNLTSLDANSLDTSSVTSM